MFGPQRVTGSAAGLGPRARSRAREPLAGPLARALVCSIEVSAGRFEVYDTGDGYGFRLFGVDGAPVLTGGPLADVRTCVDVVVQVKDLSESKANYRERDGARGFAFVVVDADGHALATSEAYGTALERDMAMTTARLLAIACPIIVRRASAAQ